MPLTAITIQNFKSIQGPIRIDLKPITLLFGPNSAGKSTIIQALHYAREIFERRNVDPGQTIIGGQHLDLGGFESLVHNHDLDRSITLRFDLDLHDEDLPRYIGDFYEYDEVRNEKSELWEAVNSVTDAWVEVSVSWSKILQQPIINRYKIGLNSFEFATIESTDDAKQFTLSGIQVSHPVFTGGLPPKESEDFFFELYSEEHNSEYFDKIGNLASHLIGTTHGLDGGYPFQIDSLDILGQGSALPNWKEPLGIRENEWIKEAFPGVEVNFVAAMSSFIVGPGELVRDALRQFAYLGPIREVPERNFAYSKSPDLSRWANGLAAWDVIHKANPGFIEEVNDWLCSKEKLNAGYRITQFVFKELNVNSSLMFALTQGRALDDEWVVKELNALPLKRRVSLREVKDGVEGIEVLPQDIGVGVSQVLPVVVLALHDIHPLNSIIAIEQPELHIHPALQVALGDLFISQAAQPEKNKTFILETHSEHLILRILRRIREKSSGELPLDAPDFSPEDIAIYFIEPSDDMTRVITIRVDGEGEFIDRWPRGFFEERIEELF